MNPRLLLASLCLAQLSLGAEPALEKKPADPAFEKFSPVLAPPPAKGFLKKGDRLAICGDSITEQKRYSRLIEDYLTVCAPELEIHARQYGWSGETAAGFLGRMQNDCLRFHPTVATTCYGMNDHRYMPYREDIGNSYREKMTAVVDAFKATGARVILGSPGCVGKMPAWVKSATGTVEDLNLSLCQLRNIDIEIAKKEQVGFADIFWPMLTSFVAGRAKYGADYMISGKDGVHPGMAGQVIMAYAFLHAAGLPGEIGTIQLPLGGGKATVTTGHEIVSQKPGEVTLRSSRYPFCATGAPDQDDSVRSGLSWLPFDQELNRFTLKTTGGTSPYYEVTWGNESKVYSAEQLRAGVNLAADLSDNPFQPAFKKVDEAIAAKENFETTEMKKDFHSPEAKQDMEGIATRDEIKHAELEKAVAEAFVPVTHTISVQAVARP